MKILIKSRYDIEKIASKPFEQKTALISITDYDWTFVQLKNKPDYLLQLAFDDIDNDVFEDELCRQPTEVERINIENKYHMMTDGQARQISEFYNDVRDKVDILICQCEHGQSRSAAIAAAILEYSCRKGISVFAHDKYYPNKMVFKKVLLQLKNNSKE